MREELIILEIKTIIRSLVSFIVSEAKQYINDEELDEYVYSYMHLLLKIIYQMDTIEYDNLVENISSDISNHFKGF